MFCYITNNWRDHPPLSREVVGQPDWEYNNQNRFAYPISRLNEDVYESGIKVSDQELERLAIERDQCYGEWNYRLMPVDCKTGKGCPPVSFS